MVGRVLFTGFPGFLGSELLPRMLERDPDTTAICLVQSKFAPLAQSRLTELTAATPSLRNRIELVEGDITSPQLGIANTRKVARTITSVYHLAAIYDLEVARDPAYRINVEGTRRVLEFARDCPGLRHLCYVSTCYVSGSYDGVFTETDLEKGQRFNNFYEETKYLAEVEVQREMRGGMPVTIFRPSIVVGDSRTGATQKYDGPYYAIQWILRQRRTAWMPVTGDPHQTELNVVPRDFVVNAMAHLSSRPERGVFHLCDPEPLTIAEMLDELGRATGRRIVRVRLPRGPMKFAIRHVPGVYRLSRIPASLLDYMAHPTRYRSPLTTPILAAAGLRVPPFPQYAPALVDFLRTHRKAAVGIMA